MTTVRGITSRVDVVWSNEHIELQKVTGVNIAYTNAASAIYKSTYTIPLLSTSDVDRVYQCDVVINTNPLTFGSNNITLDITG